MLKKRLGAECIEMEWEGRTDRIYSYYKIPSTLIIPEGCKWIGDRAFWSCRVKEAIIPEGVEYIGISAFRNCRMLEKIEIPRSVTIIEKNAFSWCGEATIILKKPQKNFGFIGEDAFRYCKDVKEEVGN